MNISNKVKHLICTIIFTFAFSMATTTFGFCCPRGLMEEPNAPEALLKK